MLVALKSKNRKVVPPTKRSNKKNYFGQYERLYRQRRRINFICLVQKEIDVPTRDVESSFRLVSKKSIPTKCRTVFQVSREDCTDGKWNHESD